ncbi:MAG TPA: DegV family protein, partial [Anaerolineae bacterium]|nr:DegV family protein [Anaerolineae bacterium]
VVPLDIHLGGQVYREGVDLTPERYFHELEQAQGFPTVSAPPPETFTALYARLGRDGGDILSIHSSQRLNGAFQTARMAANALLGRYRIAVVDSQCASLGLGYLVEAAARAAAKGMEVDEIIRLVRGMILHVYVVFFVEALDYLERDKRIGRSQALLGAMLGIKPFLTLEDGDLIPLEKVRSREETVDKLFDFIAEFAHLERMTVMQHGFVEETRMLLERLELAYPDRQFPVRAYNPSLAVHLGPSAMGVVVYEGT